MPLNVLIVANASCSGVGIIQYYLGARRLNFTFMSVRSAHTNVMLTLWRKSVEFSLIEDNPLYLADLTTGGLNKVCSTITNFHDCLSTVITLFDTPLP